MLLRVHLWLTRSHLLLLIHIHTWLLVSVLLFISTLHLVWTSLVVLFPVLRVSSISHAASASSNATLSSASSLASSHVSLHAVIILTLHLVAVRLSHLESTLTTKLLTLFALTLYEIDQLSNIISLFFVSCLFQIVFGLPEINLQRFLVEVEAF
jgi:hypothetical protein